MGYRIILAILFGVVTSAPAFDCALSIDRALLRAQRLLALQAAVIAPIKARTPDPAIPSIFELHLPAAAPQKIETTSVLSPGLIDPYLQAARELKLLDGKFLSDLRARNLSHGERTGLSDRAMAAAEVAAANSGANADVASRTAFLTVYIDGAFELPDELIPMPDLARPKWQIHTVDPVLNSAFQYAERALAHLVRRTPIRCESSQLPCPYPGLIAGPDRFREFYYWDTAFAIKGLIASGRLELAQMATENMLNAVHIYGFQPNGTRDYYLTRSQPPFLSTAVSDVYEATLAQGSPSQVAHAQDWMRRRAYPLLKKEYEFWMDPSTRFDSKTRLNHHWDLLELDRPEAHNADDDSALGRTLRDPRAAGESGHDFTRMHEGETSQIAGVLLNSMLFKMETDLADFAREIGLTAEADRFQQAAANRRFAMEALWNEKDGRYEPLNLRTGKRVNHLSAETAAPLFAKLVSYDRAARIAKSLEGLERKGGLMSSEIIDSPDQWDGYNGWTPHQMMAVIGLRQYRFSQQADRIAWAWVNANARVFSQTGTFYERINVDTAAPPVETGDKYPTQTGFLWTDMGFVWMLHELNVPFHPL